MAFTRTGIITAALLAVTVLYQVVDGDDHDCDGTPAGLKPLPSCPCCCSSSCCQCPRATVSGQFVDRPFIRGNRRIAWWAVFMIVICILSIVVAAIGVGVWRRRVYLQRTVPILNCSTPTLMEAEYPPYSLYRPYTPIQQEETIAKTPYAQY
ncbi:uncharacterized protein LOC134193209 [Corticium candelabrum]|uniref:uncharacterized protein LOC134193209 n=1 Tax=Corticium candelabrum TaxID=121492 RepID=UPI002E25D537|nr:uncharacterized protein LOC134193209 [Corticium candelabrum]